jgi:phosphoribosyl 1,2-cyclic phosphodiesterase
MVDNGFSLREALARMEQAGISPASLDGIFLTHTHGDHLKGVGPLCRRFGLPLFTAADLRLPDSLGRIPKRFELKPGSEYRFSWMECLPFATSHDADRSISFSFSIMGERITIITDTGKVTDEMAALASRSRLLFLEANYDEAMLASGPYPPFLQARISSSTGHLSNRQAADFLGALKVSEAPELTYLCHLSENNNSPECVSAEFAASAAAQMSYKVVRRGQLICGELAGGKTRNSGREVVL